MADQKKEKSPLSAPRNPFPGQRRCPCPCHLPVPCPPSAPPTLLPGGSLHGGKTRRVLTCSQILSASGGPWIVFTPSRA